MVLIFPFPMPQRPQSIPGTLKRMKPLIDVRQPNPLVFPSCIVIAWTLMFVDPHEGHFNSFIPSSVPEGDGARAP